MRTREAIRHHKKVFDGELKAIEAIDPELTDKVWSYQLTETAAVIRRSWRRSAATGLNSPRLSNTILRDAFDDLRHVSSNTKRQPKKAALSFVSEVLLPMAGLEVELEAIKGKIIGKKLDACMDAEVFFVKCIRQIRDPSIGPHDVISTYHDSEGRPLALRKTEDVSTALTLQPISVKDVVVIPAGTIVSLGKDMNNRQTGEFETRFGCLRSYIVRGPIAAGPIRLSPWAYDDVMDRSLFAVEGGSNPEYDRERARVVEPYNLEDFRVASSRLLELCEVN